MKPTNNFIDESAMALHGEMIEYVPVKAVFGADVSGLTVTEATQEEWDAVFKGSKA